MDSKETLIKAPFFQALPIFGLIFVLIASAAFFLCRTQSEQAWQIIHNYYKAHLLEQEKQLYQDFYYKRLAIEQKGTESQLETIQRAIKRQDHQTLSQIILTDRHFRIFLSQKVPIYFSAPKTEKWLVHNKILNNHLQTLPEYQFAIIPELFIAAPSIANLLVYIFIDTQLINFLSNILLFLLLSALIERFIKKGRFFIYIMASNLVFSCFYLFIANSFSPPLMALNSTIYLMALITLSIFLKSHFQKKHIHAKLYLFLGLFIISSKLVLDIYLTIFNHDFLICLTVIGACSFSIAWFYPQLFYLKTQIPVLQNNHIKGLSKHGRQKYSEALLGLSRFNFDYSRELLRKLRKDYPDSLQILESNYHLEKLQPENNHFWPLAQSRIEYCLESQNYKNMLSIFQDIQKAAPNRQLASKHISPDHYLKMLVVFLHHGDIEKAEHAFMFLELAGDPSLVKEACKLLIDIFSKKRNLKKQEHYQALLNSYI
jgi:hypothetical protein